MNDHIFKGRWLNFFGRWMIKNELLQISGNRMGL